MRLALEGGGTTPRLTSVSMSSIAVVETAEPAAIDCLLGHEYTTYNRSV